jgi:hypothetical protein
MGVVVLPFGDIWSSLMGSPQVNSWAAPTGRCYGRYWGEYGSRPDTCKPALLICNPERSFIDNGERYRSGSLVASAKVDSNGKNSREPTRHPYR